MNERESTNIVKLGTLRFADVSFSPDPCPYARLTPCDIYTIAERQANLSDAYQCRELEASSRLFFELRKSAPLPGGTLISDLMTTVETTLMESQYMAKFGDRFPNEKEHFLHEFRERLEDPGFLEHVVYTDSATDPDFLSFYWDIWFMGGVHLQNFYRGVVREPGGALHTLFPETPLGRFITIEGMALSERALYGLWNERKSSVLGISKRRNTRDERDALSDTRHAVSLLGVSSTQPIPNLRSLALSASRQLYTGGLIGIDLPIKNPSLRRLTTCLGLPTRPGVVPARTAGKAIKTARSITNSLNTELKRDGFYLSLGDVQILTFGPWGDTCLYFSLRKREI